MAYRSSSEPDFVILEDLNPPLGSISCTVDSVPSSEKDSEVLSLGIPSDTVQPSPIPSPTPILLFEIGEEVLITNNKHFAQKYGLRNKKILGKKGFVMDYDTDKVHIYVPEFDESWAIILRRF